MMKPSSWEIWDAKVAFEDDPHTLKRRPVLVISPKDIFILSLKITSHEPRKMYPGEYQIKKWREAGLNKPSTVRCSKRLNLIESDFIKKRGKLQVIDMIEVRNILHEIKSKKL
ncbi:type II toxin-antitoxin system PemK/MazF family toxin [Amedibacillus dolichus]|uniref:PemK-like protein n=1 Tax=Amedibacillus dolichus DSM 3991 TaxID=428127 RepID=A8RCY3_9FIRM|nr:type II toxin-antitoxin system PemK/MazF family toxin [Amedibacillus dolichus]EDP10937.1 hypothetical protein EUBDOL_01536 [Amedibacillus dolichus DSM 3991]